MCTVVRSLTKSCFLALSLSQCFFHFFPPLQTRVSIFHFGLSVGIYVGTVEL